MPDRELSQKETRAKIEKLLSNLGSVCVATIGSHGHPNVRAMTPMRVVGTETLWFATELESSKIIELVKDPHAAIYGASPSGAELRLWGSAFVLDDRESRKLVWRDELKKRFHSADDPSMRAIRFDVLSGMWSKDGKTGFFSN